jgi:hypothetical protein
VTLKMAKDQSLPLTPSKISGACGRLMCCLAYELSDYKELVRDIPKVGSKVKCFGQRRRLEKVDIFHGSVILSDEEENTIEVSLEELKLELGRSAAEPAEAAGRDEEPENGDQRQARQPAREKREDGRPDEGRQEGGRGEGGRGGRGRRRNR